MGSNSVLVVPTTFNTSSFASFTTGGLVHQLGTTLVIPSGYNISLSQQFADSITVQGSLTTASGTPLVENKTLTISSGGAVSTPSLEIGTTGSAGQAIQTGGLNQIYTSGFSPSQPYSGPLYLGYNSGSTGAYQLNGGTLTSGTQYVGYSGAGSFTQSGGVNNVIYSYSGFGALYVGYNTGSSGTYTLSGGQLTTYATDVGFNGTSSVGNNTFNQSSERIR